MDWPKKNTVIFTEFSGNINRTLVFFVNLRADAWRRRQKPRKQGYAATLKGYNYFTSLTINFKNLSFLKNRPKAI
jgi:hypothetical protein